MRGLGTTAPLGLPDELFVQILHYCSSRDILSFAATCNKCRNMVRESISLQLHLELDANKLDVVEGPSQDNPGYSRILEDLRGYRNAWLDLILGLPKEYIPSDPATITTELRDDSLVMDFFSYAEELGQGYPDSLDIVHLDFLGESERCLVNFDCQFEEFTLDLNQDLAILTSVRPDNSHSVQMHFRSIATGLAHPRARHSTLIATFSFNALNSWEPRFSFHIMDNLFLTQHCKQDEEFGEVLVWNWVEGTLLCRINCEPKLCDATFLDHNHILLSSLELGQDTRSLSLLVFEIPASPCGGDSTIKDHFEIFAQPTLGYILKLDFPVFLQTRYLHTRAVLRSGSTPGSIAHEGSVAFSFPRALTLGMSLKTAYIDSWEQLTDLDLSIFISVDHIFKHLKQHKLKNSSDPTMLHWNVWGEYATRWFRNIHDLDQPNRWISGSRIVVAGQDVYPGNKNLLSVLDFSTSTVRRHVDRDSSLCQIPSRVASKADLEKVAEQVKSGLEPEIARWFNIEPENWPSSARGCLDASRDHPIAYAHVIDSDLETVIYQGFQEPVVSRLPYRVVTKAEPVPNCSAWTMGHGHIVGVSRLPNSLLDQNFIYKLGSHTEAKIVSNQQVKKWPKAKFD